MRNFPVLRFGLIGLVSQLLLMGFLTSCQYLNSKEKNADPAESITRYDFLSDDTEFVGSFSSFRVRQLLSSFGRFNNTLEGSFEGISNEKWMEAELKYATFEKKYSLLRDQMSEQEKQIFKRMSGKFLLFSIERLLISLEDSFEGISNEKWVEAEHKYAEFEKQFALIRDQMSEQEQERFNKLSGRFLALKAKKAGKSIEQILKDTKSKLEGFIEAIKK